MPQKNMSPQLEARWQRRRRWVLRPDCPEGTRVLTRERVTGNPVSSFRYDQLVATGEVDRGEWANIVRSLLDEFTRGKKATFARKLGMDPKTIDHWLQGNVRVSEDSIRNVAEKTGRNAMDWLLQVGYYQVEDLPQISHEAMNEERRYVVDDDTLDDVQKAYILQELDRMEEEDEAALAQLREKDRRRRAERVQVLMEQQRSA